MPASVFLLLALVSPNAPVPPADVDRLEIEDIGIGDSEGRLITLMPTTSCSAVESDSGFADRWCRIPEQRVLGVLPRSLTATLRDDRIDTLIARMPPRAWPLLRARLVEHYGEPDERIAPLPLPLPDGRDGSATAADQLRWTRGGVVLLATERGPDGEPLLTLRAAAPAPAAPPLPPTGPAGDGGG